MDNYRTKNLAWFTDGLRPLLRRSPAMPFIHAEAPTMELEPVVLRPAVPPKPRPGQGRHRRASTSLLSRWLRV